MATMWQPGKWDMMNTYKQFCRLGKLDSANYVLKMMRTYYTRDWDQHSYTAFVFMKLKLKDYDDDEPQDESQSLGFIYE